MAKPKHIEAESQFYFVTTVAHERISIFKKAEIAEIVINALYFLRFKNRLKLHAFVVMPDHFHMIISLAENETLSKVMHSLKSYTAKKINKRMRKLGRIWQEGYYDYGIRDEKDLVLKIEYLLGNPVRKGLVESVDEYRFSSANGTYEVDYI